jgi:hypothetical protein
MRHKGLALDGIGLKLAGGDTEARKFSGYASVFGGVDSYGDTIMPGAYKNTITNRQRPIAMRWNHTGPVIGKWTEIREDEKGLYVEGELTSGHSVADDAYALLKHGAISGMSIGYFPVKEEPNETGGSDLHEIKLVEISIVETPADLSAQVGSIKSAIDEADSYKQIERLLRDAGGFSRSEAQMLVSRVKSLALSDSAAKPSEVISDLFQRAKL